jgi:hypothetical protein
MFGGNAIGSIVDADSVAALCSKASGCSPDASTRAGNDDYLRHRYEYVSSSPTSAGGRASRPRIFTPASVKKLPGLCTVEPADANGGYVRRIKVSDVDAHSAALRAIHWLPMSDATTSCAPYESEVLVSPRIARCRTSSSGYRDLIPVIVGPQGAVATTNRAVATRETARLAQDRYLNRATMAGACKHEDLRCGAASRR